MLILDLKRPTIVAVGAWNPAIFQGGWIAQHLFGVPQGQQVQFTQLIATEKPLKSILYYRGIGISVSTERLELYPNDLSEATRQLSERTFMTIVEKLPHTPINAFGVNFRFVKDAPEPELLDLIDTNERLTQLYAILNQRLTSTIRVENIQLNLQRLVDSNSVTIDFNYHHTPFERDAIPDVVTKWLGHAVSLLKEVYDLEGYDITGHQLGEPPA